MRPTWGEFGVGKGLIPAVSRQHAGAVLVACNMGMTHAAALADQALSGAYAQRAARLPAWKVDREFIGRAWQGRPPGDIRCWRSSWRLRTDTWSPFHIMSNHLAP